MAKQNRKNNRQMMQRSASLMGMFWGGLLIFIIGWGMLSDNKGEPVETDWSVIEQMVANGEIEQINIVNKEKAEVELTEEAIEKYRQQPEYKNIPESGPIQLYFTIGSVDAMREDLATAEGEAEKRVVSNMRSVRIAG